MNFKIHSSLFCIILTGERDAEYRTMLYLRGLLSCSFSMTFLIITTQSFLNLVFNSLEICEFCNANFVAVPKLRLFNERYISFLDKSKLINLYGVTSLSNTSFSIITFIKRFITE